MRKILKVGLLATALVSSSSYAFCQTVVTNDAHRWVDLVNEHEVANNNVFFHPGDTCSVDENDRLILVGTEGAVALLRLSSKGQPAVNPMGAQCPYGAEFLLPLDEVDTMAGNLKKHREAEEQQRKLVDRIRRKAE